MCTQGFVKIQYVGNHTNIFFAECIQLYFDLHQQIYPLQLYLINIAQSEHVICLVTTWAHTMLVMITVNCTYIMLQVCTCNLFCSTPH